jgi:hypothetical protein
MFARDRSKPSGHKSICKACDREKSRRYYEADRSGSWSTCGSGRSASAKPTARRGRRRPGAEAGVSANLVARCASSPLTTATFSCEIARPVSRSA